jgi:hypothetical protein
MLFISSSLRQIYFYGFIQVEGGVNFMKYFKRREQAIKV